MNAEDYEKIGRLVVALADTPDGLRFDGNTISDACCSCCGEFFFEMKDGLTPEALEDFAIYVAKSKRDAWLAELKKKREWQRLKKRLDADPEFAAEYARLAREAEAKWKEDMFKSLETVFSSNWDNAKWKEVWSK